MQRRAQSISAEEDVSGDPHHVGEVSEVEPEGEGAEGSPAPAEWRDAWRIFDAKR